MHALPVPNTVLLRLPIKMCSANKTAAKVQIISIKAPTKCEYLPQKNSKGPPQTKEKINYFGFLWPL